MQAELRRADRARQDGNEGMARVCARRAAGWAIQARHQAQAPYLSRDNALGWLEWYAANEAGAPDLRQAAHRLTVHVTKDEPHQLPHPEDPLQDAAKLVAAMRSADSA